MWFEFLKVFKIENDEHFSGYKTLLMTVGKNQYGCPEFYSFDWESINWEVKVVMWNYTVKTLKAVVTLENISDTGRKTFNEINAQ
jgi:hypothetical protein